MQNNALKIGAELPSFRNLPNVDGKKYSSSDLADADVLVIVFSCNHCPYVQAYEQRMITFQDNYAEKRVKLVAINSNDEVNYPEDNFQEMVKRAAARKFNFLYLRDVDQTAATAFGATHTPQFFVFDKKRLLRYSGKMDDNWQHPESAKEFYLRDAVDAVLAGREVGMPETFSIGCTIKWR